MFIILTGSSGVGKNTVITEIEKNSKNIKLMPTYTTREKRPTEVEGYPFHFITKQQFKDKIKENELIEYEYIHENYYGSSYKIFNEFIKQDIVLIKDIGIEGAQNLSVKMVEFTPVVKFFLTTRSKAELKQRLKGRGEKNIKLRLKRFKIEQKQKNKFDYIILNDDLQHTRELIETLYPIDITEFLPTISNNKINYKKVKKYIDMLNAGKILKPMEVVVKNNEVYIIKGHEKYLASIITQKNVAKLVINNYKKQIPEYSPQEKMDWKHIINTITLS